MDLSGASLAMVQSIMIDLDGTVFCYANEALSITSLKYLIKKFQKRGGRLGINTAQNNFEISAAS